MDETLPTPQSVRKHLHSSIQETTKIDDDMEGCVLKGWVCIAEWIDPDGRPWLTRVDGGATGESLPSWQSQGYLYSTLNDGWVPTPPGEEDEED